MVFCDFHTHLYPQHDIERLLTGAIRNFSREYQKRSSGSSVAPPAVSVLIFTESPGMNYFDSLHLEKIPCTILDTDEEASKKLVLAGHEPLFIIRGFQWVSREGLEILSVGYRPENPDPLPLLDIVNLVDQNMGIAVLPWGFGKWMFKRGGLLKDLLRQHATAPFYFGDSRSRTWFFGKSPLFRMYEDLRRPLLNGSDPLPFRGEEDIPGSFGTLLSGPFNPRKPLDSIGTLIAANRSTNIQPFGHHDGTYRFFARQIKMYRRKYLG